MEWPGCSPDMTPIEHFWDALGRRVGSPNHTPHKLPRTGKSSSLKREDQRILPTQELVCSGRATNDSKNWQWSTEGDVSVRRSIPAPMNAHTASFGIPLTANHQQLHLQWAFEHRAWQADWHQVVFSDESCFNLWDHDGGIRVRRYADEPCLPECAFERRRSLTPLVMVWGAISYHGRSNLLRIVGNLNSNRNVREVLRPEVVP
ncbi:transposable element Tcb2 transposase [Trichonephila clavipes]|nr:transposable element Tcb2 transposase [Trichonephila clavipes]